MVTFWDGSLREAFVFNDVLYDVFFILLNKISIVIYVLYRLGERTNLTAGPAAFRFSFLK